MIPSISNAMRDSLPQSATPQALLRLFEQHGGYLTSREATQAGWPSISLTRLLERGLIERPQRGVYRLRDTHTLEPRDAEAEDLLELQLRFPYARACLTSALHLHGLTTTRPMALQLAIPANRRALPVTAPAVEIYYFTPPHYDTGVTQLDVGGRTLVTYTPEKTLMDLLRYAPKFGRELYLEGLKNYLRHGNRRALTEAAKTAGVWRDLSRDLEVLSHDQDH
jgi:predicted transcriptional regulator of viral defense system